MPDGREFTIVVCLGVRDSLLVEIWRPEEFALPHAEGLAALDVLADELHTGEGHARLLDLAFDGARLDLHCTLHYEESTARGSALRTPC